MDVHDQRWKVVERSPTGKQMKKERGRFSANIMAGGGASNNNLPGRQSAQTEPQRQWRSKVQFLIVFVLSGVFFLDCAVLRAIVLQCIANCNGNACRLCDALWLIMFSNIFFCGKNCFILFYCLSPIIQSSRQGWRTHLRVSLLLSSHGLWLLEWWRTWSISATRMVHEAWPS